jgi:hypothetical protein
MMRGGGGGGGLTRHYVLEPLKNLTVLTGVVYLLAGTQRRPRRSCGSCSTSSGLSIGYVATGAPVLVDSFHQGSGQMSKYMAAHPVPGAKKNAAGSWTFKP